MTRRNNNKKIRLGTRASKLARIQTKWVIAELERVHKGFLFEEVIISTRGDRDKTKPLREMGGDGLFVKELERALLDGRVDIAVHSHKDVPAEQQEGLIIASIPKRAPSGDLFISKRYPTVDSCPPGTKVGTGSARRRVQLLWAAPGLKIVPIRGNLDTRIQKLRDGDVDAIVVAEAGLSRIGYEAAQGLNVEPLRPDVMIPAAAQGALAIQVRADDEKILNMVKAINSEEAYNCVAAERAFLAGVGGGCHHPVGALAKSTKNGISLQAMVARDEDNFVVRLAAQQEDGESANDLGARLAADAKHWIGAAMMSSGGKQ